MIEIIRVPRPRSGGCRCAYVELNLVHDEIQPSFWWLARELGFEIDFYLHRASIERDVFCDIEGEATVIPIDCRDPHQPCAHPLDVVRFWTSAYYDFLILGTAEPVDRVELALGVDLPKILFLHNLSSEQPPRVDGVTWGVLGPRPVVPRGVVQVNPAYLGQGPRGPALGPPRFLVQGNLQYSRRHYDSLLNALSELAAEGFGPERFQVRLVGRAFPESSELPLRLDGHRFQKEVKERDLGPYIELFGEDQGFPGYFSRVRECAFFLPLLDDTYGPASAYLDGKWSSSLIHGIGSALIPVVSTSYAERLGLDAGYVYEADRVADGIRSALADPFPARTSSRVAALRERSQAASVSALGSWIDRHVRRQAPLSNASHRVPGGLARSKSTGVRGTSATVAMAAHNGARWIEDTVRALFESVEYHLRRAPDDELSISIVDDGSTDETPEILRSLQGSAPCPFLLELRAVNEGRASARNDAIGKTRSALILFDDQDDEYLPEHIHVCLGLMKDNPGASFAKTGVLLEDSIHPHWYCVVTTALLQNMCVRREAHELIGGLVEDPAVDAFGNDDAIHSELLHRMFASVTTFRPTVRHRRHANSAYERQYEPKWRWAPALAMDSLDADRRALKPQVQSAAMEHAESVAARVARLQRIIHRRSRHP
jgi:hypothetical protein